MTEKRYFSVDYDEEYYIFDSTKISEEEVLEKAEYSYDVFGESLTPQEHLDLLNENEQLKQSINNLMDSDKWWEKKAKQRVQELENENEQLKQQNEVLENTIESLTAQLAHGIEDLMGDDLE